MMDAVRQWAFGLCTAALGCGLLQMLAPKTPASKLLQTAVSLFFLCCLLRPVAGLHFQTQAGMGQNTRQAQQLAQELNRVLTGAAAQQAQQTLEQTAQAVLAANGAPGAKVQAALFQGQDSQVQVSMQVWLSAQDALPPEQAQAVLQREFGAQVTAVQKEVQ